MNGGDTGRAPGPPGRWPRGRLALLAGAVAMAALLAMVIGAHQSASHPLDPIEAAIRAGWQHDTAGASPWVAQDRTQRECTRHDSRPPDREAVAIMEREWASIVFPVGGLDAGDWQRGAVLARGTAAASSPCLACHRLDARDVGPARSGPDLIGYARARAATHDHGKLVYEQIYNSNAVVACSSMPRFGAHKVLTPEQIRDIVAFLLAPESPVNAGHAASAQAPADGPRRKQAAGRLPHAALAPDQPGARRSSGP